MEQEEPQKDTTTIRPRPPRLNDEPGLEKLFIRPISLAASTFVIGYDAAMASHEENGLPQLAAARRLETADLRQLPAYKKLAANVLTLLELGFPIPEKQLKEWRRLMKPGPGVFGAMMGLEDSTKFSDYLKKVDASLVQRYDICEQIRENAAPIIEIFADPKTAKPYLVSPKKGS